MLNYSLQKIQWVWLIAILVILVHASSDIPFHGDETNHILNSLDYKTAFIDRAPQALIIDASRSNRDYYRLADGSVTRYLYGFAWHITGYIAVDLPESYWNWSGTPSMYQENVDAGNRPSTSMLSTMRLVSTLLFWLSTVILFIMSWFFQGSTSAYFVSLLYVLNAPLLLNVLRAMQEGSLLFFGVLLVSITAVMSIKDGNKWYVWAFLIVIGGFSLATKINSVSFVISALLWLFIHQIRQNVRPIVSFTKCLIAASIMLLVMIVFSPGLWYSPVNLMPEMIAERISAMNGQVIRYNENSQPLSVIKRIELLVTMPFLIYPDDEPFSNYWYRQPTPEGVFYSFQNTILGSSTLHSLVGIPATLLMLLGLLSYLKSLRRRNIKSQEFAIGVIIWYLITSLLLMSNLLAWYRYYIPIVPAAVLLAGEGFNVASTGVKSFLLSRMG